MQLFANQKQFDHNTAYEIQGKPHICNICPFADDIVSARFEDV